MSPDCSLAALGDLSDLPIFEISAGDHVMGLRMSCGSEARSHVWLTQAQCRQDRRRLFVPRLRAPTGRLFVNDVAATFHNLLDSFNHVI